jgi:hypothetical protein
LATAWIAIERTLAGLTDDEYLCCATSTASATAPSQSAAAPEAGRCANGRSSSRPSQNSTSR